MALISMIHVDVELPISEDVDDEIVFKKALRVVEKCRPDWLQTPEGIHFKYFTLGMTNRILSCWHNSNGNEDRLLLRIFGENTDLDDELKYMLMAYENGFGVPVYASFKNGLAYGYVPGEVLTRETIKDKHISVLIARKMAQMHMILPKDNCTPKMVVFDKIYDYITNLPDKFDNKETQLKCETQFPSRETLISEASFMLKIIESLKCKIVFSHNDLLINNVLYDKQRDCVNFIDYEYGGWNPQAFDIADHFCEYVGMDDEIDWDLFPSEDVQIWWVEQYLIEWHKLNNLPIPNKEDILKTFIQVACLSPIAHLWWSIWSVIQAKNSTIQFDYLQYGIDRFGQYKRLKMIALGILDKNGYKY